MRGWRIPILTILLALGLGRISWAGVYNSAEEIGPLPENLRNTRKASPAQFEHFQKTLLIPLREIGSPSKRVQSSIKKRYDLLALAAANPATRWTVEQRLDLGAYLIRTAKYREAAQVLELANREEPRNFLVLANLATAEFLFNASTGQFPQRPLDYARETLRSWPAEWDGLTKDKQTALRRFGWSPADYQWFRKVETYFAKLLELRAKERPNAMPETPDALFDTKDKGPLRFVGESGKFEAGKLAVAEESKLPNDAIPIVEQLVLWLPHDNRLYWLLGELFNAKGDTVSAKAIFNEVEAKFNPKKTDEDEDGKVEAKSPPTSFSFNRKIVPELFKEHHKILKDHPDPPDPATGMVEGTETKSGKDDKASGPPLHWQSLGIGFGTGMLVMLFAYWQVREIRRRRQLRAQGLRWKEPSA